MFHGFKVDLLEMYKNRETDRDIPLTSLFLKCQQQQKLEQA